MEGDVLPLRTVCHLVLALIFAAASPAAAAQKVLPIAPVMQDTPVWCWAAISEMVFKHFGAGNARPGNLFQCGIVEAMAAGTVRSACEQNCFLPGCVHAAGTPQYMMQVFQEYPKRAARKLSSAQPRLATTYAPRPLTLPEIRAQIDAGRPVVVGINPAGQSGAPGASQHVALVVGYDDEAATLTINDPGPYQKSRLEHFRVNPYISAGGQADELEGRYTIPVARFAQQLGWTETLLVSQTGAVQPEDVPQYCCTAVGRLGPYPNTNFGGFAIEKGATCVARHPGKGDLIGIACN